MRTNVRRSTVVLFALLVGASVGPGTLRAHDEGVLKVPNKTVGVGDSLHVVGEQFTKNSKLKLFLVGIDGRWELLEVGANAKGGFTTDVRIPPEARAGAYRLLAIAADGDEVAALDLVLTAAAEVDHEAMGHGDSEGVAPPSAEPLDLARAGSSFVTGGAVLASVLALGLGLWLLRRRDGTA